MVIGLTGGVGAGKSRISAILKEKYAAELLIADRIARTLMEPGHPGHEAVICAFGHGFLKEDGCLDRHLLAHRLFHDEEALRLMNGLIHPMVWSVVRERISSFHGTLLVIEAAIMGQEQKKIFDELWYVYATEENRIKRLLENRGYDKERSLSVMRNQPTPDQYRAMADRIIDNNGSEAAARAALAAIWKDKGRIT